MKIRYVFQLALLVLLLANCSKNNDSYTYNIQFDVDEARPYQPITILKIASDYYTHQESYTATLGAEEIVFNRPEINYSFSNEEAFVGYVPGNINPGTYELVIEIDGETYTHEIDILPNEIVVDPDILFSDFEQKYVNSDIFNYIEDTVDFKLALQELKSLQGDDKELAAQILANNIPAVEAIELALADAEQNTGRDFGKVGCDIPCKVGAVTAVLGAVLSAPALTAIGTGVLATLVIKRIIIPVVKALIKKVYDAVVFTLNLGYDRMATVAEMVYDSAANLISNKTQALPDTLFVERGKALNLSIKTLREPIVKWDNRGAYAFVDDFFKVYDILIAKLSIIGLGLPGVSAGTVSDYPADLDGFSMEVDNPNVTVSNITGSTELASVTFNSSMSSELVFTFTYSYTNDLNEKSNISQLCKLVFNACDGLTDVVDIDGNVYSVVAIGNQCWMAENLYVRHYNDGTPLAEVSSDTNKASNSYTYYDYNSLNESAYGLMYDYSSAAYNAAKGLCPQGWHTPTEGEWLSLIRSAGNAGALKSAGQLWDAPNTGATNSVGFNAVPAGYVIPELPSTPTAKNNFFDKGKIGRFWIYDSFAAWSKPVIDFSFDSDVHAMETLHSFGYASCRCVKD